MIISLDSDLGVTLRQHARACLFCLSAYPAIAMQAPKNVMCHKYVNPTETPANSHKCKH